MTDLIKSVLKQSPYFLAELPAELLVKAENDGDKPQILVVSKLTPAKIFLEKHAKLNFIFVGTAGWQDLNVIEFHFVGEGAELEFMGLIVGNNEDQFKFETLSKHVVPNTKARYQVKAAMFGASVVDYKGNIVIEKNAQITDAYLSHDTLLLSEKSRAKTVPALEIEADDVKCGHAATIGKVDEELMFYIRSRGIDTKLAEEMLINGFFAGLIDQIHDDDLKAKLYDELRAHLPLKNDLF